MHLQSHVVKSTRRSVIEEKVTDYILKSAKFSSFVGALWDSDFILFHIVLDMISHDIVEILVIWLWHLVEIIFNLEGQGWSNLPLDVLVISDLIIFILRQLKLLCLQIIKLSSCIIKKLFDIHDVERKSSHAINFPFDTSSTASPLSILSLHVFLHIKVPHMITIQHGEESLRFFFEGSKLDLVHDGEAFHDKAELLHADLFQVSTQVFTIN